MSRLIRHSEATGALAESRANAAEGRWFRCLTAGTILVVAAVLLGARLGHYPLWDDEALTALNAQGVWQSGDTTAVHGMNIAAYGRGLLLRNLHDRSTPPLPSYMAAPFIGLLGHSAWAARLPFAVMGLLCVGLILRWLYKDRADRITWLLVGLGICCNVSLWLYFRHCRYYAPAILFCVAIAYLYLHWKGRWQRAGAIAILSLGLLATHYLVFAALWACIGVDYLLWGRKQARLTAGQWALLLVPQVLLGAVIVGTWNTLGTGNGQTFYANGLAEKLRLFAWLCRDIQANEYAIGLLMVAAPLLYLWEANPWLVRGPLAVLVCLLVTAALSPTAVRDRQFSQFADVRYVAFMIPLCIVIAAMSLRAICHRSRWLGIALAAVAFGTNLLQGGPFQSWRDASGVKGQLGRLVWPADLPPAGVRSTIGCFVRELAQPSEEPYSPAIDWINANVPAGKSILVQPQHMIYPLMYHCPQAIYAWQLPWPPPEQFRALPPIHFVLQAWPDYILVFGPQIQEVMGLLNSDRAAGVQYEPVTILDRYWQDRYRPELFFRTFQTNRNYSRETQAIYILRRVR